MSRVSEGWARNSNFLLAKSVLLKIHNQGLINSQEFDLALENLMEQFHPPIESLDYPKQVE